MSLQSLSDDLAETRRARDKWRGVAQEMRAKVEEVVPGLDARIQELEEALRHLLASTEPDQHKNTPASTAPHQCPWCQAREALRE